MLLIHVCCADCTLKLLTAVESDLGLTATEYALFYLNPNIHPESEYLARMAALKKVIESRSIKLIIPNWRPKDYFSCFIKYGSPAWIPKNIRCPHCWYLRLLQTFEYARLNGYDTITSTLLTSIYQDTDTITSIAQKLSHKSGVKVYIPKAIDHYQLTSGFYKQNYCGCVFSLKERMDEKYLPPSAIL